MRRLPTLALAAALLIPGCGAATSADPAPVAAQPPPTTTTTPAPFTTTPPPTTEPTPTTTRPPPTTATTPPPTTEPTPTTRPALEFPRGIEPTRIEIPAIGVDAVTVDLDLSGTTPEVPEDFDDTGWYVQSRRPGEIGPAIIAGHVDSRSGPAVFFRLGDLTAGDRVTVHAADGEARTFEVTGSGRYPKDELPPEVFGFGAGAAELRLITCGGDFDRSSGHYVDNVVVYTRLVDA